MKKIFNIIISMATAISLASAANAGNIGFGVTGSYAKIEASGSETSTGNAAVSGSFDNNVLLGSIYAEYSLNDASWGSAGNGFTIGAQYTPGTAEVSNNTITTTVTASPVNDGDTGTKSANAEVENYRNYYIEVPVFKALYVKAGRSKIDVNTLETSSITKNAGAGEAPGTFPNTELDGTNLGIGLKGVSSKNIVWKIAYEKTDFDTLNLTSTTSQTVRADLDTSEVNFSIGYRF